MSVFARADVAGVSVSPEHGGCGQFHGRPVVQGAPVELWELSCPPCEDHLRSDPLWSSSVSKIPETPDEAAAHEDWKRRSEKDTQFLLALALAKMAGEDVPESMRRALSGKSAAIPGTVLCRGGHENRAGSRFCSECGDPMGANAVSAASKAPALTRAAPAPAGADEDVRDAVEDAVPAEESEAGDGDMDARAQAVNIEAMPLSRLKALAQKAGVAVARSKADQIAALRAAGF